MPIVLPIILLSMGVGALVLLSVSDDGPVPDHPPDLPADALPPAGFLKSTRYRLVDKILPQLKAAADSSGIPLGLLVGWIAKESGGKIGEKTSLGEVGLFQLMPSEYKKLGLDPDRLSTDVTYSINGGLALIGTYMGAVDDLGIARRGTQFFWLLVKLVHTMGDGAVKKIVKMAEDAGAAGSWGALERFALDHDAEILHAAKHSPKKWFPFVDAVYLAGAPFGFGSGSAVVGGQGGGGKIFDDIVDPLDALN